MVLTVFTEGAAARPVDCERLFLSELTKQMTPNHLIRFNVRGTVHRQMCMLCNQRDATYTMLFIIISALHVSGGFSAHHQELIKLYVQPWVLSCFPVVYRWCGWGSNSTTPAVDSRKA